MSSRSNGRPEPEVIMNVGERARRVRCVAHVLVVVVVVSAQFVDGYSYSKGKLEEAFRPGGVLDHYPSKPPKDSTAVKRDDVDLIVHELEIPRIHAEKALIEHKGDLASTLRALISPVSKA